jgi:hypothetical protein
MGASDGRDDFTEDTKRRLRLRAGNHCSFTGCNQITSGPSDQSTRAVANVGKAAHISSAATGGPRYDASLSPEQRSSIDNGIWCCSTHADLIDRDVLKYTIAGLHRMKAEHEALIDSQVRDRTGAFRVADLVSIGPAIMFYGSLAGISEGEWQFHVDFFVEGDFPGLIRFIDDFANKSAANRYVLVSSIGDGRMLANAPSVTRLPEGYVICCPIESRFPRIRAQDLPSEWAISAETDDLYVKDRQIARVKGLEALPQRIRSSLSMRQGESPMHPEYGTRLAEYYAAFTGTVWFDHLLKLEVIRQAAIPYTDPHSGRQYTPLHSVDMVRDVSVLPEPPRGPRLLVQLNLDVHGLGQWKGDLWVHILNISGSARRAAGK